MRIPIIFGYFFGLLVMACAADSRLVRLYGSDEALRTISEPDFVEVCALSHEWKKSADGEIGMVGVYHESSAYQRLSDTDVRFLSSTLLSTKSFNFDETKDCIPEHNLRARFHRGQFQVTVEFCFGCDMLEVVSVTGLELTYTVEPQPGRDYSVVRNYHLEDFDPVAEELFKFALRLFPSDTTLQELEVLREKWKKRREERANQSVEPTPVSAPR